MQEDWTKYKVQPQEDFSEYIVKKKEPAVESNLVSTPEQEFLTGEAEKRRSYEAFLSNVDKRDKESAKAASEKINLAEQPISFINESNYANRRLEAIRRNVPRFAEEAHALQAQLQTATPENIEEINAAIDRLEGWIKPVQTRTVESQDPREYETWSNYRDEAKSDSYFAVKNLQEDNERLKKAASFSKGAEEAVKSANEQFSDEDLKRFIEFDENPRRLQGATEDEREKYTSYRGMIGSGKTIEDVEDARKALGLGIVTGVKEYVEGYTKLTDELRGNRAVTELMDKINKVEQGEDVEFTSDDNLLMKALVDNAQLHEELDGEIPQAYRIGESLGTSIGFMAEFLATGGGAQAVGKQVLKTAAETGAKKAIGKLGVGTAVKLAQAGIQTAKMPSFYKGIAENVSNGMGTGEAILNAYWETGAETLSERIFMSSPVKGLAGKGADDLLRRAGINFSVDKGAIGVFKNTLEEAAEEKIGEIMTAPKDYDSFKDFWKGFTDVEQNITMLGSVGLMTGGMGSVALSGNTLAETRRKARVKRIEKFVPSDLRAEIDIITGNTDLTLEQQYGLIGDAISSRIDSQELGEDPATTTGNAMQYAQYKIQEQVANTVDENAVVENGEITIGTVEEVGNMQDQLDYLNEKGVDANGLNAEQVQKLYDKTKSEEDKQAIDEAIGVAEEIPTETIEGTAKTEEKPSQKEDKFATKTVPMPDFMRGEYYTDADRKQFEKEQKEGKFDYQETPSGEFVIHRGTTEGAIGFDVHGGVGSTWTIHKAHAEDYGDVQSKVLPKDAKVLTLVDQVKMDDNEQGFEELARIAGIDRADIPDAPLHDSWQSIEEEAGMAEGELMQAIKDAGYDAVMTQGLDGTEVYVLNENKLRDIQPRAEQLKEETKDDEKELQEKRSETRQGGSEQENQEVEVSEEGDEARQEDVVQEVGGEKSLKDKGYSLKEELNMFTKKPVYKIVDKDGNEISSNESKEKAISDALSDIERIEDEKTWSSLPFDEFSEKVKRKHGLKGKVSKSMAESIAKSLGVKSPQRILKGLISTTKKKTVPSVGIGRVGKDVYLYNTGDVLKAVYNEIKSTEPILTPTEAKTEQKGTITPTEEKVAEKPSKKALREQRFKEIDDALATELENLADIIGATKKLTGEQRAKLMPTVARVTQLVAEKGVLKAQEIVDEVIEYFKGKNIELDDEVISKIKEDASKIETLRKSSKEAEQEKGKQEGEPVRGVREKHRAKAAPKEEKIKGKTVKKSRLGIRYAYGENLSEKAKEAYRENRLHEYTPESHQDVISIAESIIELNDLEKVHSVFDNKNLPRRIRVVVGALLAKEYSDMAEKSAREGNTDNADEFIDKEQALIKSMQDDLATESGRDVSIFGAKLVSDILTPYKTARQIERAAQSQKEDIESSKGYKETKTMMSGDLYDLRKRVLREIGKQERVRKAKEKAKKNTDNDPKKVRLKKEISDLADMFKAAGMTTLTSGGINAEQIEIGAKIAARYIELGVVNVKELIAKIKSTLAKVGVGITDAEARRMIPPINGKSIDEVEKEQVVQEAAKKLATQEFGYVADKKASKNDPVSQMVNTLVAKFRERAKEGQKHAHKSNLDVVTEAIVNKNEYMGVWKEAKKEVDKIIDNNEELTYDQKIDYKKRVQDSYDKATSFSVSEKRVQQLIRESLKEQDISIDDVVRDHYERKELHKQQLIEDLINKSGLTDEAAKELADTIDNAFNTLMTEKGVSIVNKYLGKGKKDKPKKKQKDDVARLIELVNIGAMETAEGNELFGELYGVPNVTKEELAEIKRLADLVQKTKSPQKRHKNAQRLMTYVCGLKKVDPAEIAVGFWYGNILFGMGTHMKNYFDAYINSWTATMRLAGYNPLLIARAVKAHARGYWGEGATRFKETMDTGITPISEKFDVPGVLERGEFAIKDKSILGKGFITLANWYKNALKFNLRLLPGFDTLIYSSAQEAAADIIASRDVMASYSGQKMTRELRKEIQKEIDAKLAITPDIRHRLETKVEQESKEYAETQKSLGEEPTGYSQREKNIRLYELINAERPIDIVEDSLDIAGRALGNIGAYGFIGRMVSVLSSNILRMAEVTFRKPVYQLKNITKKGRPIFTYQEGKEITTKPLSLVMAFTRIVANVATRNLGGNMMVAIARARKGRFGIFLGKNDPYRVDMTKAEKDASKRYVWKLAIMYSLLYLLTEPGEDKEDPVLQITLNGTGDYKRNKKELEGTGWQPYSIIVTNPFNRDKDFHLDYRLMGQFAVPLMAIGYMRDRQRYQDDDRSDMALMAEGIFVSIPLVLETTPVYGLRKITDAFFDITKGGDDGFNKLLQLTGGMATGFIPAPRIIGEMEDVWDVVNEEPHKTAVSGKEKLLQYIPFYGKLMPYGRTAYNVFGEEIPASFSVKRIIGNSKEDKLIQYYLHNGYSRPIHEMSNTSFLLYDKAGNIVRRKLSGNRRDEVDLFNDYDQAVGMAFKEAVIEASEDGLVGEEMVEYLDKSWSKIVEDAKGAVLSVTEDYPVKYEKDIEVIK